MKAKYIFWLLFFTGVINLAAQTSKEYAVLLHAEVAENPASIRLKWINDTAGTGYEIYRKTKDEVEWGNPVITLPNTATEYTDHNVITGIGYEYYVHRTYGVNTRFAHGYIYAGIKLPIDLLKGKLLLLIDANYELPLAAEIAQLKMDLIADGWNVKKMTVQRNASVPVVKSMIAAEMTGNDPAKALYLLGHIPVPYSGKFVAVDGEIYPPDGHPDHGGAWPADLYYGVMNESIWTDNLVNDINPARIENRNIPGDGKFDVSYIYPDTVALQIGRVDLINMPALGLSDTLLVKRYLNKAHQFKTGQTPVLRRGLIDDHFGPLNGEAFAASGWGSFATIFGDSVFERPYLASAKKGNYLFTYGCGAGTYTGTSGVCMTSDFTNDSINQIFTMLFGSYFGDWDVQDNMLRAPLGSANGGLASVWSGRPHWHFHHMSMGENIGYSTRLSQNNYSDFTNGNSFGYFYNSYPTFVHIALMGDPSLRLHMNPPMQTMQATPSADSLTVTLTWPLQNGADGYIILKSTSIDGQFRFAKQTGPSETTYTDPTPYTGYTIYMARSYKLEQTPSGSYYNMSLGVIDSAYSKNTTALKEINQAKQLEVSLFPNPTIGSVTIVTTNLQHAHVEVYDITGKLLLAQPMESPFTTVDLGGYHKGLYFVKVISNEGEAIRKVMLQ